MVVTSGSFLASFKTTILIKSSCVEPQNVEGGKELSLYCIQHVLVVFVCMAHKYQFFYLPICYRVKSSSNAYLLLEKKNLKNKEFKVVKFYQHLLGFQ